jgi:hypothetical protein
MGHIPIGMEMFNAGNETQWEMIQRRIEESDYYIVIIARRYGSVHKESGVGYTEREWDYATSLGIPTIGFVLSSDASWPTNKGESDPKMQKALTKFITKVEDKMRASWSNKHELAASVSLSLNETMTGFPGVGWIRADKAPHPEITSELARLSRENSELRKQLESSSSSAAVLLPEFQIDCEIVWNTTGFGPPHPSHLYQLRVVLTNIGNAAADAVEAVIEVPQDAVYRTSASAEGLHDGYFKVAIDNRKAHVRSSIHKLPSRSSVLPGKSIGTTVLLTADAVENPGTYVLKYSIYPGIGHSKSGEIALADIPVSVSTEHAQERE